MLQRFGYCYRKVKRLLTRRNKSMKTRLLASLYEVGRVFSQSDYDSNEDYWCGSCSRPVFRRLLYCSKKCEDNVLFTNEGIEARDKALANVEGHVPNPDFSPDDLKKAVKAKREEKEIKILRDGYGAWVSDPNKAVQRAVEENIKGVFVDNEEKIK